MNIFHNLLFYFPGKNFGNPFLQIIAFKIALHFYYCNFAIEL